MVQYCYMLPNCSMKTNTFLSQPYLNKVTGTIITLSSFSHTINCYLSWLSASIFINPVIPQSLTNPHLFQRYDLKIFLRNLYFRMLEDITFWKWIRVKQWLPLNHKKYLKWLGYRPDYNGIDKGICFLCNNILR